jgi:formate-dependent nitrite reductase membrane component NrfD
MSMVPPAAPRSYYGRPLLKGPVWEPDIAAYFFTGGLAGASATLAATARRRGNDVLAQRALLLALAGLSISPVLLVRDLGRPARFHHMLRVLKVTSPMSVGTWVLSATGLATSVAAGCELLGVMPRLRTVTEVAAGALGPVLSTYTAVLIADTAVPAWHEARFELPFVFAGSSAASAGAAAALVTPAASAAPARRLCAAGALLELAASGVMERRLGEAGQPYSTGGNALSGRLAKGLTAAGALTLALTGRRRSAATLGGLAVLAGAACLRWTVLAAGAHSVRDPAHTVGPQRARIERGESQGA